MNLKQLLFQKYAAEGRDRLVAELKQTHEPKKGDRFHITGITYEVGQIVPVENGMEFEISSKIPIEELSGKQTPAKFFKAIEKFCDKSSKKPEYAGMDDIVQKIGEREIKKRDYVRLRYRYTFEELFDEQEIQREAEAIARNESSREVPEIPGVVSIAGRLVLLSLRESVYQHSKDKMTRLIEANKQVREEFKSN